MSAVNLVNTVNAVTMRPPSGDLADAVMALPVPCDAMGDASNPRKNRLGCFLCLRQPDFRESQFAGSISDRISTRSSELNFSKFSVAIPVCVVPRM